MELCICVHFTHVLISGQVKDEMAQVVISGVACRLPQSDNIAEFRDHLMNGDDMVTENDSRFEPGKEKCIFIGNLVMSVDKIITII